MEFNRSVPPPPARAAARPQAAIWSRSDLARQQPMAERFAALGILLVSIVGSLLFGGGGVDAWLTLSPSWIGATAALIGQLVLSYFQYIYAATKPPVYWILIVASSTMTILGFWPLVHEPLTNAVAWATGDSLIAPYAPWLAGGGIILAGIIADVLPEHILTK